MTTIHIELSDSTAQAARAAGLLTPQAFERLLSSALRKQQAAQYLIAIANDNANANIAPMSMADIQAEVQASRQTKRLSQLQE